MGDLTFNESFGCLDRGDFHEWVGYLFETIKDGEWVDEVERLHEIYGALVTPLFNELY